MSEQQNSSVAVLDDDGVSREDAFRRAAFAWALSTKKMVESAAALGPNTRVARAALDDVEYARSLLDSLYLPQMVKTPGAYADGGGPVSAAEVKQSVSNLATRIITMPLREVTEQIPESPILREVRKTPFNARVERSTHRGVDMGVPVYSKNGKMLWAGVDCPVCPALATQRCKKDDGGFIEKPHKERKTLAEQGQNA